MPPNNLDQPFDVQLTRQAEKDLQDLRAHTHRVSRVLAALSLYSLKGHVLTGSLRGVRSLEFSLPGSEHRATARHWCRR